jgi:predicted ATP-dependent endonuclease of OLD family
MKLKIENIGMIRHADIRLDGLTIIAGENDTGKSTVGKLIFSLVKAFNRYEQDLKESKSDRVFKLIEKTYFELRQEYDFKEYPELRELFFPPFFASKLKDSKADPIISIEDRVIFLEKLGALDFIENLESIKKLYLEDENKDSIIKRALNKALFSEFYLELTPKYSELTSLIHLSEGKNEISSISIKNNRVESLNLYDELFFNDVTFVETPIFLQMYELIRSAATLFEMEDSDELRFRMGRSKVALHIKDLILKLENAQYFSFQQESLFNGRLDGLLTTIENITKGSGFSFEKKERDFYFNKNENTKFKSINTATGLKSFGIIQLLIQANILNERSLLIIDEPEIHLHPKWQVEYAKLIVLLVKNDIPVLLTSHSPEIIQALNVFSEKFGIQDRTAYYLTESDGVSSDINDVTKDINKIFAKLAEPLHNLVWG